MAWHSTSPGTIALPTVAGARPFEPLPGRVMREYAIPPEAISRENAPLSGWLIRGYRLADSLPPEVPKKPGRRGH